MISKRALRAIRFCTLLAIALMILYFLFAEEEAIPAKNGWTSGTEYSTGKVYLGNAADYRKYDILTLLELLPGTSWDKEEHENYTRFSNNNADRIFVEKGRIY